MVWAWKALESMRNTLRMADVLIVESFEVRILVVCRVLYTNLSREISRKHECEDHRSGKVLRYMLNWCGYVTFLPHVGAGRDGGRG